MAVRFAERYRHQYTAIFWIHGADIVRINDGFSGICRTLNLGDDVGANSSVPRAQRWLTLHHDWLMIIDNLDDDASIDLLRHDFLTVGMNGTILITSRNGMVKRTWQSIEVSDMKPEEATVLMEKIAGSHLIGDPGLSDLLKDLGNLPLAVDQAASFINETEITLSQYRDLLTAERLRPLEKFPSTLYNFEYRQNVMTTWEISFNRVRQDDPEASDLLLRLSLLHHENISMAMLESVLYEQFHWAPNGEFEELPPRDRWVPPELSTVFSNNLRLVETIAALRKFSLIRKEANASLHVHPLVHCWASQRLQTNGALEQRLKICVIGLVASSFDQQDLLQPVFPRTFGHGGDWEPSLRLWPWRQYPHLVPHTIRCLQYVKQIDPMPVAMAQLSLSLLQVLEYATAEGFTEDHKLSLSIIDHILKPSPETPQSYYLHISAYIWRLARLDLCPCRKSIPTWRIEIPDSVRRRPCRKCDEAYEQLTWAKSWLTDQRMDCASRCLLFRLSWDRIWESSSWYRHLTELLSEDFLEHTFGTRKRFENHKMSFEQYVLACSSWM